MNKILYIFSLFSILMMSGCEDFLEPKSQDKIIPKTIVDLKEFLLGEVIKDKEDYSIYLAFMTDDISDDFFKSKRRDKKLNFWGYYTWQQEPEMTKDNRERTDEAWDNYYHKIFICNVILNQIPEMEGTVEEKDLLAAETHFMRAHCYFALINLYGEPYDKNTASTALGIPINEEVGIINNRYQRKSVEKVYTKIKDELTESIRLFKNSKRFTSIARPSLNTAYLLMSRIYLFKKDYENAEKYASLVITSKGDRIQNLNSYSEAHFMSKSNSGILFTFGKRGAYEFSKSWNNIYYTVSNDLLNSFTDSDLRKSLFFKDGSFGWKPKKYIDGMTNSYGKAYRIYEAYLNRAEANVELGHNDLALKDMKYLYSFRHEDTENITATTKQEIIELIQKDRRLEFCFEDFRWFDLRRYGMPRLEHRYITSDGDLSFVLEEKSKAYTLPIPKKIRELNLDIERIKRPEQKKNK